MAAKKKSAAKKSATKKTPAKKSTAKKTPTKKSATKKKTVGKGGAKKSAKKGLAAKTFAEAGAKMHKMLARGQKGIRGLQSKVVEIEEKSRAFLADASSPAIKKIRNLAKKAKQARPGNGSARRKASKSKGKGKAAKVVSHELSKLGDSLKDVFTPHSSPSDAN